jgi:hypothetical protein
MKNFITISICLIIAGSIGMLMFQIFGAEKVWVNISLGVFLSGIFLAITGVAFNKNKPI